MEKNMVSGVIMSKFLATVGDNVPVILCEEHARVFEKIMIVLETPHTIYEIDEPIEGEEEPKCQACNLVPDIIDNMPRIQLLH